MKTGNIPNVAVCLLLLWTAAQADSRVVPEAVAHDDRKLPPQLRPGAQIRVRDAYSDAWMTGTLIRVDVDSLAMVDDLIGERVTVPMTPRLQAQVEVTSSVAEVRRRHAMRAGTAVGGFLSIGVLGCLQGCNSGGEVAGAVATTVFITGAAALIGHTLPAREGTSWRDVPLTPTLTLAPDQGAMLSVKWKR